MDKTTPRRNTAWTLLLLSGLTLPWTAQASGSPATKIANDANQFASGKPSTLQPIFNALYVEGEHNAVLNFDYLGLAALEQGEYAIAEKSLDAAILRIEAIYANNPNAQKAKSLFSAEKVKDFKGEPYERAMTYYYRGILYLRAGDYQNARASFLAAEWQSTLSDNESYDSSFGLMDFLAGWSSYCDGDDARATELRDRAAKVQPEIFGSLQPSVSYLGLIDLGVGPVKYGVGQYKEKLAFKATQTPPDIHSVAALPATVNSPVLAGDINWQATTRSGRPVDAILNGKAQWKSGTEATSAALTTVGYATTLRGMYSGNQNLEQAGAIGMAAGLVGSLFAHAMTPAADTRAWISLPAGVSVETGELQGLGIPSMSFEFGDSNSPGSSVVNARAGKCAFSWGRTHSSVTAAVSKMQSLAPDESRREAANAQFRSMLESTFAAAETVQTVANQKRE
jgi:tetratricopeptide (TPR) repeat protein